MNHSQRRGMRHESQVGLKNVAASPLQIIFLSLDDEFILANESAVRRFGDLVNRSIFELLDSASQPIYLHAKKQLMESDQWHSTSIEVNFRSPNAAVLRSSLTLSLVRDPQGRPQHFRGILRQDTESSSNASSTPRAPNLAPKVALIMVAAVDKNGIFTLCEGALAANIIPNIVGRHFEEVYDGVSETPKRIRRAMNGERFDVEVYFHGFWYHVWYSPLKTTDGHLNGATWTSYPIDRQKHAEAQLQQAIKKEQEATRLREDLLSIASHEIRGPLSTLSLQVQLLEMAMQNNPDGPSVLEAARMLIDSGQRQIKHMSALLEKTLDVSRINDQGVALDNHECDLAELLKDVIRKCSQRARTAACDIHLTAPQSLRGSWDACRMEQVIENLISNAIKYGAGQPVSVKLSTKGDLAIFEVQDHGIGISCSDQKKIFERFVRAKECKNISGFGMGLYIVKQIVDAHGGTISVSSELGNGATFRVEIPFQGQGKRISSSDSGGP